MILKARRWKIIIIIPAPASQFTDPSLESGKEIWGYFPIFLLLLSLLHLLKDYPIWLQWPSFSFLQVTWVTGDCISSYLGQYGWNEPTKLILQIPASVESSLHHVLVGLAVLCCKLSPGLASLKPGSLMGGEPFPGSLPASLTIP